MFPFDPAARRLRQALVSSLLLIAAAPLACRGGGGEGEIPETEILATISGEPVPRAAFDAWASAILTPGGEPGEAPSPELMSRLLDRFLDEELLVREAKRRGIDVSEREVTEALRRLVSPESAESPGGGAPGAREATRRSLLVRKIKEEEVLKDLRVEDDEVAAYYEAHRDEFHQTARLVLRQILVEDAAQAKAIRGELQKDPKRFEEIAATASLAPDRGRARAYQEAELPSEIVEAMKGVPVGGISEVVTSPEGSRIFLLEKRDAERLVGIEEASDRIRVTLLQEKGRDVYEAFMTRLREESGLAVREGNLPFSYRRRSA